MAQPRNFVCGQILSAIIGITVRVIIPKPWIAAPVGMSLALFAMQLTRTTHPPGEQVGGRVRSLRIVGLLRCMVGNGCVCVGGGASYL
jgi:hypothetical protein